MVQKTLEDILDSFQVEKLKAAVAEENQDFLNPTKLWARKKGDEFIVLMGFLTAIPMGF